MTLTLSIAQIAPSKGDYPANLRRLRSVFAQLEALETRPAVLHLPETALTGYFVEGGVRELAMSAGALARDLDQAYRANAKKQPPLDIVVGFYERWRHTLYNSALYVRVGDDGDAPRVMHVHRKNFLPTYGMFDEERFVERGFTTRAFDTAWGRAGMLVCEDAWHSVSGTMLALDGAEIVFVCSAAPGRGMLPDPSAPPGPANVARWERLMRDIAEEHGVFVSLSNLAGSEGGKMFTGSSVIVGPAGDVRGRAPTWSESLLVAPIDLRDVSRVRAEAPMLSDLRVALPHIRRELDAIEQGAGAAAAAMPLYDPADDDVGAGADHALVHPDPGEPRSGALPVHLLDRAHPVSPSGATLAIDAALVESWLVHFLREELRQRGFARAVVGVSGGVDSAVTAVLAARALGADNVIGVRMPYRTSSSDSLEHGQRVIDTLGIVGRTVDISAAVDGYLSQEPDADPQRRGNVMARMRMITLFDLAAKHQAIPLGTGNKTERLFGYFTWHADDSPPVNPIGDLYKTQVWELARHLAVPEVIVAKPASADLIEGQTDEGDLGISYARADVILHWLLSGYTPAELAELGFDPEQVELVRRRVEGTHWKRRMPTVALLSQTAIGESYLRPVDY